MEAPQPTTLGNIRDLPVGDTKVVKIADQEILLIHLDSGFFALRNHCIHGSCRLSNGVLKGETLRCLCHGSVFNVKTGEVLDGPATQPQPVYNVSVQDGEITLAP